MSPERQHILKVAAQLPDSTAVDTVLSLGFLNSENIVEFLKALPILNDSQQQLCTLLRKGNIEGCAVFP